MKRIPAPFPARHGGWLPALWIFYLAFPVIALVEGGAGGEAWAWEGAGLAAFLLLYARGYWTERAWERWLIVALLFALGAALTAFVASNNVIVFTFAAVFACHDRRLWAAASGLAGICAAVFALIPFGALDLGGAVVTAILCLVVGLAQVFFYRYRDTNERLKEARQEVERLAKIAERERIARDLHDLLGHTLSLIVLKSELAKKLAGSRPERAAKEIAEVEQTARQALSQVRAAVRGYRTDGFMAELARARAALEGASIRCVAEAPAEALPPASEGVLALILREAVTNVLRHSGARRCSIALAASPGGLTLAVEDDGRGAQGAPEGSGLRGMRERVAALGGALTLGPRPGGGAALIASVPREGREAPARELADHPEAA
jgi:two-component system, NarL family, sensor histidine kinase DesK